MNSKKNSINFNTLFSKSTIKIIEELQKSTQPLQFKDFKTLENPKRNNGKYSSRTISESLKDLEEIGLIENQIITKNKRKTFGYSLTKKGKETFNILKEAQSKYEKL